MLKVIWFKKKKLLDELLYFYAIVNTNVQMASLMEGVPDRDKTFRNIVTALNQCVSKVVFDVIDPIELQKRIQKDLELKKIWSTIQIKKPTAKPTEERADYFS